jgi:predicted kinase
MVTPPLRCHLLIGPPASGKSTLAEVLAERTGAIVLSTDAIRAELYGDAAVQGPWSEIETLFHQRLKDAVAAGQPVILDGTHSQRPWRLAILQVLKLPAPVQWIGWWLTTPLEQCLAWNQQRPRQVPEEVIRRQFAQLLDRSKIRTSRLVLKEGQNPDFPVGPDGQPNSFIDRQRSHFREEGFASVVAIDPAAINGTLRDHIDGAASHLDRAIQMARSRKAKVVLHRYSRLLDLERLIFLIRLLLEFPGVDLADPAVEQELRPSFRFAKEAPLPDEEEPSFATRAAYAVRHRHGLCYGDENAIAEDLHWLLEQRFARVDDAEVKGAVEPGQACDRAEQMREVGAGFPAAADKEVFQRQFGLLRHLIHHPFDHPPDQSKESSGDEPGLSLLVLRRRTFLIQLLREFPEVRLSDPRLCESFRVEPSEMAPSEEDSLATRAAYVLKRRHGPSYGDAFELVEDLDWLKRQKTTWQQELANGTSTSSGTESVDVNAPEIGDEGLELLQGPLQALFTEQPDASFDFAPPWTVQKEKTLKRARKPRIPPPSLRVHLMQRLGDLDVAQYGASRPIYARRSQNKEPQVRTLDKDLEVLIKAYGFTTIHKRDNAIS